ncbi:uncharacterized protein LOC123192569 isoform X2 [Mangifera indica]|uniref:uncharacterized protein LOC123192569 isoform X2 n=1 Tax=Mangifera indica TaxID=29780 RepID=UPI001CFBC301|nr:uncharacterized protein LOC123192569 isoform X2 [Mangifera indica]
MAKASLIPAYSACSTRLGNTGRNGASDHGPLASSTFVSCSCFSSSSNFNFSSGINNWKHQGFKAQAMSTTTQENFASSRGIVNGRNDPDHLLVLVHGILASPSDWTYVEAELKRRLGRNFLIYASSSNTYTKTFTGVDGAGKRLADEVMQVVKKTDSLKKISFLAHSLGGLFARYAVAVLYSPTPSGSGEPVDLADSKMANSQTLFFPRRGTIAGLEPVNFITLATPHLGVRGRKQLPFLFGVPILEKLAAPLAPIFVGRTGRQLFLTDGKPNKPPLLLRMASDCEDINFLSALGAFRVRILYANVSYDHMVGWRTSSIRRETELVKDTFHGGSSKSLPWEIMKFEPWINFTGLLVDLWMVTSMLWMWNIVHQFPLMGHILLKKQSRQRRQHKRNPVCNILWNIMKLWKRR